MSKGLIDTIAAIATPIGEGGIGIVRISGPKALRIADKIFVSKSGAKPSSYASHSLRYGHIVGENAIDEVLLTVMRAPRSYTKEDIVEINCHGGTVPLRKVLEEIVKSGARLAEPGEFTKRAFLNGRIDLAQAEAVAGIIMSKTEASLRAALSLLKGDLSREIRRHREIILDILKDVEAAIDFSEEDIDAGSLNGMKESLADAVKNLEEMLDNADAGILMREGLTCVICGKPNVGKSSLLNALLKRNRAIVTDIPGTTRDVIEEYANIGSIPVKIVDTAGIIKTRDIIGKKGIEKTKEYLKKADLAVFMLDLSLPFEAEDRAVIKLLPMDRAVIVANKADLKCRLDISRVREIMNKDIIRISVLRRKNIKLVEKAISDKIWEGKISHPEAAFIQDMRHKKAVRHALRSLKDAMTQLNGEPALELIAVDLKKAVSDLGLITGETVDTEILDRIFANFCIGK